MMRKVLLVGIVALGGIWLFNETSVADLCDTPGCVTASDIPDDAIRKKHVRDGSVITSKIRNRDVTSEKIAKGAVGSDELAEDIVLGKSRNGGSLTIERSSGADILNASNDVILGQAGRTRATRSDTDLFIRDPFFSGGQGVALWFNASGSDLWLGSGIGGIAGDDGDLYLKREGGGVNIHLNGDTGSATNSLDGNGFVKAWARINADGTVASCWRCDTGGSTRRFDTGIYWVDFAPLSTDIRSRPRSATLDSHTSGAQGGGTIVLHDAGGPNSLVVVNTRDTGGDFANRSFTLIIY